MLPNTPRPETGQACDRPLNQSELLLMAYSESNLDKVKLRLDQCLGHSPHAAAAADLIDEAILYLKLAAAGQ